MLGTRPYRYWEPEQRIDCQLLLPLLPPLLLPDGVEAQALQYPHEVEDEAEQEPLQQALQHLRQGEGEAEPEGVADPEKGQARSTCDVLELLL